MTRPNLKTALTRSSAPTRNSAPRSRHTRPSCDTTTMVETLITAAEQVEAVGAAGIVEVVGDKGYHSNEMLSPK